MSLLPTSALCVPPSSLRSLRSLLLVLGAIAAPAAAQDLGIKAPPQTAPIVITGATIHPISRPAIENGFIVFEGGKITSVGDGSPPHPKGGQTIDAKGKHIYPGLIAAHTQLGLAEMESIRATNDFSEVGNITPEVKAAVAVNPDSTLIPVARSNGILIAGAFPQGGTIPGRVSVIRLDGWTSEEMTVKADSGLAVSWPNVRPVNAWWMDRSESEQADDIRKSLAVIDDAFKTAAAYAAAHAADPSLPIDIRWEAMRGVLQPNSSSASPATSKQLPVFIAAQDIDQITSVVTWSMEHHVKPVIVGGRDAALCADLLKRHDIPVIINGTHAFPKRADSPYDDAYTLPARLAAAGVKFCIASADKNANERNLPYNAATAVAYGLDHEAALKAITLWPAEILGVSDTLGSLEPGKAATLFIASGDPLEIPTRVEAAYIDGRKIDLSNKQDKLAEKYREKYRQQRSR